MLDIRRALEYMSEDPQASEKLGLGAVVSLAPVLNLAALGYQVEVVRRVAHGESRPLPEWNDLRRLWVQGARLGLAYFIYGLPLMLIVFSGMGLAFFGLLLSAESDPARTGTGPLAPPPLLVGLFVVIVAVALLYSFILGLLRPAILAEYAQRRTLAACFDFAAMWRFTQQAVGEYLLLWLAEIVLGWIVSLPLFFIVLVAGLVPFAGPLAVALIASLAGFFLLLVSGHLVGQLLRAQPHSPA